MIVLLAALACDTNVRGDDSGDTSGGNADTTYYKDVKPLLDVHCTRCHYEGGLGIGDFTDPDTVVSFAEVMLNQVEVGAMPPATSDPECHDYSGSEHMNMSAGELAVLQAWIDQGKELGDVADDPGVEPIKETLDDADISLLMTEAYTPSFSDEANPGNEYRCFVLDPELDEDVYINALAPAVDNAALVHHVVAFTTDRGDISESQWDPQGFDCIDMSGAGEGMLGAWAPGMLPLELGEGNALKLDKDDVVVLQMHYFQSQATWEDDRSGYELRTMPKEEVETQVLLVPLGLSRFEIPAGDDAYTDGGDFENTYPLEVKIHNIFPHMHVLGKSYSASITHADGSTTCLVQGDYDFDNQLTYQFEGELPVLGQGDTLEYSCTWNNSTSNPDLPYDEPVTTGYGERTDEEMCYFFSMISY